jgi:hypothetical protein
VNSIIHFLNQINCNWIIESLLYLYIGARTLCSDIFFIFICTTSIIKFSIYLCSKFFWSFRATFCFTDLDYCLIQMIPPPVLWISEGLLYLHELCHSSNLQDELLTLTVIKIPTWTGRLDLTYPICRYLYACTFVICFVKNSSKLTLPVKCLRSVVHINAACAVFSMKFYNCRHIYKLS